ncbi:hypothetical protein ACIHDR_07075 [Nocardia sp. NPDC052278]|uniref:hypothetical protein n=1 Tax=unclassified Nocardia TaxID=2637762 RepID=UPI0036BA295C
MVRDVDARTLLSGIAASFANAQTKDSGVKLEVCVGGPAIGLQTVPSQMYLDQSIPLGPAHSERSIAAAGQQPIVVVTTLLRNSPQLLMCDPKTHPDWHGIADIGKSGVRSSFRKVSSIQIGWCRADSSLRNRSTPPTATRRRASSLARPSRSRAL